MSYLPSTGSEDVGGSEWLQVFLQRHFDFEDKNSFQPSYKHSFENHENERLNPNFDKNEDYFCFPKPSFNTAELSTSNDPERKSWFRLKFPFEMTRTSHGYSHLNRWDD